MRLGGMNRPGRILGTEYDAIMLSELSQFSEDQYQMLKTRCSGSAGNWRDKNGDVQFQISCDTNPDVPDSWMYQRETEGLIKFVKFGFADNPYFFRGGRWSKVGKTTVEELDRGLTGIYHDRYFKGLRRAPEGMVFDLQDSDIIEELPVDIDSWMHYNCMDFGMSAPSVTLWIAESPKTGEIVVFREWRHTQKTSIDMGNEVRVLRDTNKERILKTIIDNDEEKKRLLLTHCRIRSELTEKGPGSVFHRTLLVQNALKEKKLKFYRHLRCNSDSELIRNKKPLDVISELRLAHYPVNASADSNPVKGADHGIDALGYWFLWREGRRRGTVGFATGSATPAKEGLTLQLAHIKQNGAVAQKATLSKASLRALATPIVVRRGGGRATGLDLATDFLFDQTLPPPDPSSSWRTLESSRKDLLNLPYMQLAQVALDS